MGHKLALKFSLRRASAFKRPGTAPRSSNGVRARKHPRNPCVGQSFGVGRRVGHVAGSWSVYGVLVECQNIRLWQIAPPVVTSKTSEKALSFVRHRLNLLA